MEGFNQASAETVDLRRYAYLLTRIRDAMLKVKKEYSVLGQYMEGLKANLRSELPKWYKNCKHEATDGTPRPEFLSRASNNIEYIINTHGNMDAVNMRYLWDNFVHEIDSLLALFETLNEEAKSIERSVEKRRNQKDFVLAKPIVPVCNLKGNSVASCACLGSPSNPFSMQFQTCHVLKANDACSSDQACRKGLKCIDNKCATPLSFRSVGGKGPRQEDNAKGATGVASSNGATNVALILLVLLFCTGLML